mgnify:CR=1 FL=1
MANEKIVIKTSSIETIDKAVYNFIQDDLNLHTNTNGGFRKVPVLWISPERAFHIKEKEIRDSVGKLKLPLITIERTGFDKDPQFKGGFQANIFPETSGIRGYRKHQRKIKKEISEKPTNKFASTDSFEKNQQHHYPYSNSKIVMEEYYTPIPVWVSCLYSITLRCEYQQQMNDLMTPFATRTGNINAAIIKEGNHKYEAFIQSGFSQSNNLSNLGEDERSFQSKIDIKVLGYLLGDGVNEEVPAVIKKETVVEVKLVRERTIVGDEKPWVTDNKKYRDI